MTKASMKKDYFWNTVGVFAQNAVSPLLLIAVTRINGVVDSGLFSFALSISLMLFSLGLWGGRTYQVSDVRREFEQRNYIMARVLLAFVMVVGGLVFSLLNHYDMSKTALILVLVIFKVVESLADVMYGVMQIHNKLYVSGMSLLYKAIGAIGLFTVTDIMTRNLLLSCAAVVVVNTSVFLLYDLRIVHGLERINILREGIGRTFGSAIKILQRCSPIFAVSFLGMFSLNIPRYFVDQYHQEQIGYFGIMAMPITLIVLLMSFVLQPNVVGLSRQYASGNYDNFNGTVMKILAITVGVGIVTLAGAWAIGVQMFQLIFGINFSGYQTALLIMVLGGVLNAMVAIFIIIMTIMRVFKAQFYILLLTNILLLGVSVFAIKSGGLLMSVGLFTAVNLLQFILLILSYSGKLVRDRHEKTT